MLVESEKYENIRDYLIGQFGVNSLPLIIGFVIFLVFPGFSLIQDFLVSLVMNFSTSISKWIYTSIEGGASFP